MTSGICVESGTDDLQRSQPQRNVAGRVDFPNSITVPVNGFPENMAETKRLCLLKAQHGKRVSTFVADVSIEDQVLAFAEAVTRDLDTHHIHLLFNNAGIGTLGGSFVDGNRAEWDKTFNVCWYGVYYCTRAFLPLLRKGDEGHIVNTSSVNGF